MRSNPTSRASVLFAAVALCAAACSEGPSVAPSPTPPTANPTPPITSFVGDYSITVDLPESCTNIPESLRRRIYQAKVTLAGPSDVVPDVRVVGAGYSEQMLLGALYYRFGTSGLTLDWNNFFEQECTDFKAERLEDGRLLKICGQGGAQVVGSDV